MAAGQQQVDRETLKIKLSDQASLEVKTIQELLLKNSVRTIESMEPDCKSRPHFNFTNIDVTFSMIYSEELLNSIKDILVDNQKTIAIAESVT